MLFIAASSASAMQIASSTRQQSVGIEQIWQATKEIDRIATETASGISQLESAAGNMKQLAGVMAEIVGRYKIHFEPEAKLERMRDRDRPSGVMDRPRGMEGDATREKGGRA